MVSLESVSKTYRTRRGSSFFALGDLRQVKALDEVSLQVNEGEFLVVRGPSGSGKTTLLLTIGGMLRPTEGRVIVNGNDVYAMSERRRAQFRAQHIGFVFQMFHLVPYLNVIENVLLPTGAGRWQERRETGGGSKAKGDREHSPRFSAEARELLKRLRMSGREYHKPSELSVGERQRTAIARAMLNRPRVILADEPTGNLDPENADEVIGYLAEFHRDGGTVIVVTHGRVADQYADRLVHLREGRIEDSGQPEVEV